jgi:hypothetical protein
MTTSSTPRFCSVGKSFPPSRAPGLRDVAIQLNAGVHQGLFTRRSTRRQGHRSKSLNADQNPRRNLCSRAASKFGKAC